MTPQKLRGGFYTPQPLVDACLERIGALMPGAARLDVLEPSAGDGAFLARLAAAGWAERIGRVVAIEPDAAEAGKAREALAATPLEPEFVVASTLAWGRASDERFDAAVGNPPFVRYQFVAPPDQAHAAELGERLGLPLRAVGNLWIPVLLAALSHLRPGGAFAFVVPAECLTGCSAAALRQWLIGECAETRFDLFPATSFPGVLQEVAILSGRRGPPARRRARIAIVDHAAGGRRWTHLADDAGPWTRLLLDPAQLEAVAQARALPVTRPLGELAAFEVSIVTGANGFFSVDAATLAASGLARWAIPLLPRIRHAPGLVLTQRDWERARDAGVRAWLLHFSASAPDPREHALAAAYLRTGEAAGLHARYKCRIREPWFRVPGIVRGELLLSKRSHRWPRVVLNEAGAYTTDTIYRGRVRSRAHTAADIAASFHSTLTLLGAELEGRSFGGGVLELVPSEIARLPVLVPDRSRDLLADLDAAARTGGGEDVIEATDRHLVRAGALPADLLAPLREARELLAARRLARSSRRPLRSS